MRKKDGRWRVILIGLGLSMLARWKQSTIAGKRKGRSNGASWICIWRSASAQRKTRNGQRESDTRHAQATVLRPASWKPIASKQAPRKPQAGSVVTIYRVSLVCVVVIMVLWCAATEVPKAIGDTRQGLRFGGGYITESDGLNRRRALRECLRLSDPRHMSTALLRHGPAILRHGPQLHRLRRSSPLSALAVVVNCLAYVASSITTSIC
jgi:hypothetical protein